MAHAVVVVPHAQDDDIEQGFRSQRFRAELEQRLRSNNIAKLEKETESHYKRGARPYEGIINLWASRWPFADLPAPLPQTPFLFHESTWLVLDGAAIGRDEQLIREIHNRDALWAVTYLWEATLSIGLILDVLINEPSKNSIVVCSIALVMVLSASLFPFVIRRRNMLMIPRYGSSLKGLLVSFDLVQTQFIWLIVGTASFSGSTVLFSFLLFVQDIVEWCLWRLDEVHIDTIFLRLVKSTIYAETEAVFNEKPIDWLVIPIQEGEPTRLSNFLEMVIFGTFTLGIIPNGIGLFLVSNWIILVLLGWGLIALPFFAFNAKGVKARAIRFFESVGDMDVLFALRCAASFIVLVLSCASSRGTGTILVG